MSALPASDVIVVGGGLVGASAALFLRRRKRSVLLLEAGLVGQQASGVNFGNVRRQGRPLHQLPLAQRARPLWQNARELVGADVEYIEPGHLRVCYQGATDVAAAYEQYARDAREYGLGIELYAGEAIHKRFPFLGPEVLLASFAPGDGHANPRLAAPAFARAATREGATIVENCEVAAIGKSGEDFRVVATDGREFRAPVVLIAAGAWGNKLSERFGEPAPVLPLGPTMSVTEPVPYAIAPSVSVSSPHEIESVYFRQITRGNVIIGGSTRQPSYPDIRRAWVQPRHTLSQLQQIRRLMPALSRLNIIRVWSGIEGYLPDRLPVMGPSARVPGLFYAFGFSGSGFQIAPGVGEVMAEWIDTGATTTPIEGCDIARFA